MYQVCLTLSIVLGCLYTELTGLGSGGLVSAGYLAMEMDSPLRLLATVLIALVTYSLVSLLSRVLIVYGRRRYVLCILIGMLLSLMSRMVPATVDVRAIGLVVPGLIANDMVRQGVWKTLLSLFILSSALCLVMLLLLRKGV